MMIELCQLDPAGLRYAAGLDYADVMKEGDEVSVTWEMANIHDPDALCLYHFGNKIGYIPRPINAILLRLMEQGLVFRLTAAQTGSAKLKLEWEKGRDRTVDGAGPLS